MDLKIIQGILIPFLGTSLGAACVLFMKKDLNIKIQKILTGFAAGVWWQRQYGVLLFHQLNSRKIWENLLFYRLL